jgi:Transposase
LRSSFVPPKPIRELRDLTRYRKTLIRERQREANRLHKVLEDAGIKLACVASDVLGVSGRAMIEALVAGEGDEPARFSVYRWVVNGGNRAPTTSPGRTRPRFQAFLSALSRRP